MNAEILELTNDEIDQVSGGDEGCYYNGQLYSLGSVINTPAGQQTCMVYAETGRFYWSKPAPTVKNIQ